MVGGAHPIEFGVLAFISSFKQLSASHIPEALRERCPKSATIFGQIALAAQKPMK